MAPSACVRWYQYNNKCTHGKAAWHAACVGAIAAATSYAGALRSRQSTPGILEISRVRTMLRQVFGFSAAEAAAFFFFSLR